MLPCISPTHYPRLSVLVKRGENQFEVYIGRIRSPSGSRRAVGFFEQVKRGAKAKGRRVSYSRSSSSVRAMTFNRRVVIKASIKKIAGHGHNALRKHLDYIQRDGTDERGDRAKAYGRGVEDFDRIDVNQEDLERDQKKAMKDFAATCKNDRHHFRIIVSPEDGAKLQDLTAYTRDLVARMEHDLGTKLEWVAANHYDTGQPHTHLIIRGVRDDGKDLVIPRKYIAHTLRQRAQELVTEELGPVSQMEGRVRMARTVHAKGATALDSSIQNRIQDGEIDMGEPVPKGRVWQRQLQVRRLRVLETMGLAERLGSGRWAIDPSFTQTLRDLAERNQMVKAIHRSLEHNGQAVGFVTEHNRFDPNHHNSSPISGVVQHFGRPDDTRDGGFVIIRTTSGNHLYAKVSEDAVFDSLQKGQVVTFKPHQKGARKIDHSIAEFAKSHNGNYSEVRHVTEGGSVSPAYAQAHVRRLESLRRHDLVTRQQDGTWQIPKDYLERASNYEAVRALRMPASMERGSTQTLSQMERARGATWLDKQLVENGNGNIADKAINASLIKRQRELKNMGLNIDESGHLQKAALSELTEMDLKSAAGKYSEAYGKTYVPLGNARQVEGVYREAIERPSGKFAVIERSRDFTLVPWRPVMERRLGQSISGRVSAGGISWNVSKVRGVSR